MEIFRTDGGGRTENSPRLVKVIGNVMNRIPPTSNLWKNVKSVSDEKGKLKIILFEHFINSMDETFLYYLFMKEWDNIGEDSNLVSIEHTSIAIRSFDKFKNGEVI